MKNEKIFIVTRSVVNTPTMNKIEISALSNDKYFFSNRQPALGMTTSIRKDDKRIRFSPLRALHVAAIRERDEIVELKERIDQKVEYIKRIDKMIKSGEWK